jgi:heme o synthase
MNSSGEQRRGTSAAQGGDQDVTQIELVSLPGGWRDYVEMCKPRVVLLMLLTAAAGMLLAAPALPSLPLFAATLGGIALVGGSAAVINHVADAHIDLLMTRTRARPVATGRVPAFRALVFSAVIGVAGMVLLVTLVNPLTAWLNLLSWAGYGLVYTLLLKRLTPHNIVIGGLFGAAPPLFGWTAVTGTLAVEPVLLVLIIFVWTPPHFWALALDRIDDYRSAGVPMLPITHGPRRTREYVFAYSLVLAAASLLPWAIGMSGTAYLIVAALLNAGFIAWAVALLRERPGAPMRMFRYSIHYLGALFVALLADHYLPAGAG